MLKRAAGWPLKTVPGEFPQPRLASKEQPKSGRELGAPGRVAHLSLKKVRQQSCDFVHEHGATVDSRSALYYFPCCFNDCSVGFRLC
jgi:hypothetical protein